MKKMVVRRKKTPDGYLTVAEVASILRVTPRTVHNYLHKDNLPYIKIGKYNLIEKDNLSRWIQKQTNMNLSEWKTYVNEKD